MGSLGGIHGSLGGADGTLGPMGPGPQGPPILPPSYTSSVLSYPYLILSISGLARPGQASLVLLRGMVPTAGCQAGRSEKQSNNVHNILFSHKKLMYARILVFFRRIFVLCELFELIGSTCQMPVAFWRQRANISS